MKKMTSYSDIAAWSQDSIDSFVKANTAAVKGFETFAKHFVEVSSKNYEDAVEAGKKLAGAKSASDLFQIQTKLAQDSFSTFVEEGKTVSELSTSIFADVTAPFAPKFTKPASVKKAA
jgi:phasin family protein